MNLLRGFVKEAGELAHEAEEKAEDLAHEAEELAHEAEEAAEGLVLEAEDAVKKRGSSHVLENIQSSLEGKKSQFGEGHAIIDSVWFQVAVTSMTMLNTLQMGFEADHPDWKMTWLVCENVFTGGFAVEMVIKLCIFKCKYFTDAANLLDGALTSIAILDCWVLAALGGGAGMDLQSLSVLRILRLLRFARILKLVRSVRPLVLVIQGVVKAMSTAVYVFGLCIFVFYVFAIFLTEHLGKSTEDLYPGYTAIDEEIDSQSFMLNYNPYLHFGTMTYSMLTLFNMAVLAEWPEIIRPILMKQPWFLPIFLFFATCVGFGVMNVLIGVIVDVVTTESKKIESDYRDQVKKEKLKVLEKIQVLLREIDTNNDGAIDETELGQAMKDNEQLQQLLGSIDLPRGWSSDELLMMLDNNGDGTLQHPEFTTSFFRLMDSDDFQQICIVQASINLVKHLVLNQGRNFGAKLLAMESDISSLKAALLPTANNIRQGPAVRSAMEKEGCSIADPCSKPCDKLYQDSAACEQNLIKSEMTRDQLEGPTLDASHNFIAGGELISSVQLREVLDAALIAVKEHVHEEFLAFKPFLDSGLRCSRLDNGSLNEVAEPCSAWPSKPVNTPLELPACHRDTAGNMCQTNGSAANLDRGGLECSRIELRPATDKPNVSKKEGSATVSTLMPDSALASDAPSSAHLEARSSAHIQADEHAGDCKNTLNPAYEHAGDCKNTLNPGSMQLEQFTDSMPDLLPDSHLSESHQLLAICPQDDIHEFFFEDGAQRLGFIIHWVEDGPRVGEVKLGGASNLQGVLPGDRLVACNGIAVDTKDREEILQLLAIRPLVLKMMRS